MQGPHAVVVTDLFVGAVLKSDLAVAAPTWIGAVTMLQKCAVAQAIRVPAEADVAMELRGDVKVLWTAQGAPAVVVAGVAVDARWSAMMNVVPAGVLTPAATQQIEGQHLVEVQNASHLLCAPSHLPSSAALTQTEQHKRRQLPAPRNWSMISHWPHGSLVRKRMSPWMPIHASQSSLPGLRARPSHAHRQRLHRPPGRRGVVGGGTLRPVSKASFEHPLAVLEGRLRCARKFFNGDGREL